jgi:hypothetical protein
MIQQMRYALPCPFLIGEQLDRLIKELSLLTHKDV